MARRDVPPQVCCRKRNCTALASRLAFGRSNPQRGGPPARLRHFPGDVESSLERSGAAPSLPWDRPARWRFFRAQDDAVLMPGFSA